MLIDVIKILFLLYLVDVVTSDRMVWNSALDRVLSEMASNRLYFGRVAEIIKRLRK